MNMTTNHEGTGPVPSPKATKVTGSGGRPRTVWVCYHGCWHGSSGQASKCKNAASDWASPHQPLREF